MSTLRFCFLTTFFPPYSFGGDAVGVRRLAEALARRGHAVTVVHDKDAYRITSPAGDPPPLPPPEGVRVIALESRLGLLAPVLVHQLGAPVAHAGTLRALLAPGAFDVIWFHNVSLLGAPKLLASGDGLKVYEAHEHWLVCPTHVLWRHGREVCTERQCLRCVLRYHRPPQLWRYTGALPRMVRHIDLFIAKSAFSRDKHRAFGFPSDMAVVPHFLPDEPVTGASGPPHPRPFFLFAGRLERIKGLDDVIPRFANYRDADLLIAGSGPHEPELRRLAAGLDNVVFLGQLGEGRLTDYYRQAIAVLVPSVCYETFALVTIEAFRQGTPVVARNLGALPEIVAQSHAGALFDDAQELPAILQRLQHDTAHHAALAAAARDSFPRLWSEAAVLRQYFDLLAEAARRSGRVPLADALAAA